MRKDKKSSYQAKKEKLQKIKRTIEALKIFKTAKTIDNQTWKMMYIELIEELWEITKNE